MGVITGEHSLPLFSYCGIGFYLRSVCCILVVMDEDIKNKLKPSLGEMSMNPVVRSMILSDFFILSAFSIYGPVFAIFIIGQINGGSALTVGFATASYWIVRSAIQLPISKTLDRLDSERVNFRALLTGSFLFSIVPFMFIFATEPWHIYLLQAVYGIGDSLAAPTYLSVFSNHLDKKRRNFEWGTRSVLIGVGTSVAAVGGGFLADHYGFHVIFILTGLLATFGSSLLIYSRYKDFEQLAKK